MRALVLSGGGAKGAYQVGALRRIMKESNREYEILCGVSVGALNVAALGMTRIGDPKGAFDRLESFWMTLDNPKVWKKRVWGNILSAFFEVSIYDATPLANVVRANLDPAVLARSGKRIRVGAVALDSGEYRSAKQDDPNFVDWVLASSSFPVFFQPIRIDGKTWSDGGIRNVTPLGEAIRLGATEVDVIMCSNPDVPNLWDPTGKRAVETAIRAIDIMGDEIVRTDLEVAGLKNDLARLDASYREVAIRVIKPMKILASNPLDFSPASIRAMMATGYEDATWSERP